MKRLGHLLLCDKSQPNRVKLRLDTLSHLQTLKTTWAGRWIEDGGLANMISLRRLGIERLSQERINLVISILKRMCYLQSLSLEPNLVKLSLIGSELQKDSIVQLERLPYLKMLVLGNQSYNWRELVCSSEGFPQLQVLHLVSLIGGMGSGRQCNDEAQASKDRKLPKTEKDSRKIEVVYYYSREIRDCCNGHRFRTADLIESI
ncbi:PREDICTED: disease resistance [Prunus dulcis]|uniref:PREDICTED: disease resistance n=1 Tax=Prunus dulcis TaxID=3755 RepID=A0A5E4FZE6_PRUDU|nr:PREDICTED: disease resistance [Prunus dulcis]